MDKKWTLTNLQAKKLGESVDQLDFELSKLNEIFLDFEECFRDVKRSFKFISKLKDKLK